ncbi:MAG: DUF308 domain-containing protein [Nocardioides sp.]|uniref:HdeD family acid-resistance protein n=1 Tax=Nocardioides sp. TaxID=35761 RepID=UPI0039E667CE
MRDLPEAGIPTEGRDQMIKDLLSVSWKLLVVRGLIGILFGIAAMAWPLDTALALAVLWGVWALVDAIGTFTQVFAPGTTAGSQVLLILLGAISMIAAFFAIIHPALAAATLIWILGIWLIVRGVFELGGALSATAGGARGLILLSAVLDVVLGLLFVSHPGHSAVGIAWLLGLIALCWGIVFLVGGAMVRSRLKSLPDEPALPR